MSSAVEPSRPAAWEPLTPPGVAAFARATAGRVWLVQGIVAALAGAVVVWFLWRDWLPVANDAMRQLPGEGEIHKGELEWSGGSPEALAQNRFIGFAVDLGHDGGIGNESDLQFEFGKSSVQINSLLGYVPVNYPAETEIPFNHTDLVPWWGAWRPAMLAGAGAVFAGGLMLSWQVMALLYAPPVWLVAFLLNRDLKLRQSWRLAGAAPLPGALFLSMAIAAYGLAWLDLIQLGAAFAAHFVIGWIYLFAAPMCLPKTAAVVSPGKNPFGGVKNGGAEEEPARPANPFSNGKESKADPAPPGADDGS